VRLSEAEDPIEYYLPRWTAPSTRKRALNRRRKQTSFSGNPLSLQLPRHCPSKPPHWRPSAPTFPLSSSSRPSYPLPTLLPTTQFLQRFPAAPASPQLSSSPFWSSLSSSLYRSSGRLPIQSQDHSSLHPIRRVSRYYHPRFVEIESPFWSLCLFREQTRCRSSKKQKGWLQSSSTLPKI